MTLRLKDVAVAVTLALSLNFPTVASVAESTVPEDSIRAETAVTIEQAKQLLATRSFSALDSGVLLLKPMARRLEAELGSSDTLLAIVYHSLGTCYLRQRDFDGALVLTERALAIWDGIAKSNHLQLLRTLNLLTECGLYSNDLVLAERAIERRFALLDTLPAPLNPQEQRDLAEALMDRGRLRTLQARYQMATDDMFRGLALVTDETPRAPLLRAEITGNIAWMLSMSGDRPQGEQYFRQTLDLMKQVHHPEHPDVLKSYMYLFAVIRSQGELQRAKPWLDSAYTLAEQILDSSSGLYGPLHQNKSRLRMAEDSVELALVFAEKSVAIAHSRGSAFPTEHLMDGLENAGGIAVAAGNVDLAVERFNELVSQRNLFLQTVFGYASEEQKLRYANNYPQILNLYLSAAAAIQNSNMSRGVLEMIATGKGMVIDAVAREQSVALCANDPTLDSLVSERSSTCSQIARLALAAGGDEGVIEKLNQLYARKNQIEQLLSKQCAAFAVTRNASVISASAIAEKLERHSILWEFVKFNRVDCAKLYKDGASLGPWYAAVTVTSHGDITLVDLGPAQTVDSLIAEFRDRMENAMQMHLQGDSQASLNQFKRVSTELYEALVKPLAYTLNGVERIYVSPDGLLNLLPFEILQDSDGDYLIEEKEFVYLTSGRDLLQQNAGAPESTTVIFAEPDYMAEPEMTAESPQFLASRGQSRSPECLSSMFAPLYMAGVEGETVARQLRDAGQFDVSLSMGSEANEHTLKQMAVPPHILHVATHGYFCQASDRKALSNPLLRSGLILAGANRTIGGLNQDPTHGEDGILTALELSGLNLLGTDLVVLSACQTGAGDARDGEGVFGLRRSVRLAGARSLIMGMFSLPDESTVALMEQFYENWLSGMSKSAALRQSALSALQERKESGASTHPIFWGGFAFTGNPN